MTLGDHLVSGNEKTILDAVSVLAVVGSLTDVLPHVAALFTIVWTGMRIGETAYSWYKGKEPENKE